MPSPATASSMVSMPKLPTTLLLMVLVTPAWGAAGQLYCCTDPGSGRRVCGDTLPSLCRGQAHRIFDRGGNLIKEVAAPLTPEQKAAAAAEAARIAQQEEDRRERRRIDQALLATYATAEDIDIAQKNTEGNVQQSIQAAHGKIIELQKQQRRLAEEAEFYKRKSMPNDLEIKLRTVAHEIRLQQELIELKRKELATIRAKYDTDRQRYFELTGTSHPAKATPPASSSSSR